MKLIKQHFTRTALLLAALAIVGCNSSGDPGGSDMDNMAAQLGVSKQAAAEKAAAEKAAADKAAAEKAAADKLAADVAAAEAAKRAAEDAKNETSITITVKNPQNLMPKVTTDKDGKVTSVGGILGEGGGYYSAIAAAHRHITTRVDDLAWTQAVRSFWAEKGRYPRSHEEFMKEVIAKYEIPLPDIEQDEELFYAAPGTELSEGDFGTLYVVKKEPPKSGAAEQPTEQAPVAR